jgi:hypothetical protein
MSRDKLIANASPTVTLHYSYFSLRAHLASHSSHNPDSTSRMETALAFQTHHTIREWANFVEYLDGVCFGR